MSEDQKLSIAKIIYPSGSSLLTIVPVYHCTCEVKMHGDGRLLYVRAGCYCTPLRHRHFLHMTLTFGGSAAVKEELWMNCPGSRWLSILLIASEASQMEGVDGGEGACVNDSWRDVTSTNIVLARMIF